MTEQTPLPRHCLRKCIKLLVCQPCSWIADCCEDRTGKAHDTEILGLTSTIEGGWLLGR